MRVPLKVVCPAGHVLARVIADPAQGLVLEIPHQTLGVSPRDGESVRVDRKGVLHRARLADDDASLEASCVHCGTDHQVSPSILRSEIAAHRRRVVLQPWL